MCTASITSLDSWASRTGTAPSFFVGCSMPWTGPCGCFRLGRRGRSSPSSATLWTGPSSPNLPPGPLRPFRKDEKAVRMAWNVRLIAPVNRFGLGAGALAGRDTVLSRERALAAPRGWAAKFDIPCLFPGRLPLVVRILVFGRNTG